MQTDIALSASFARKTARAEASRSGLQHVMVMMHDVGKRENSIEAVLEFAQATMKLLQKNNIKVNDVL